ncbi:UBP-type zinc finger domain-containing protein [Kitasatospora sp. NPDC127059]|uniref:UBP-type zinc finger domain-containing protein n=1 Tax=unclassified Kitasatospora TaxID=2633591 RepID=UPI0036605B47
MSACEDLAMAPRDIEPAPPTDGCADCLAQGSRDWVHLRVCLDCGHIGCCDNSPQRHATAHFHNTSHPVIRSYEPGEDWRWCYVHELMG